MCGKLTTRGLDTFLQHYEAAVANPIPEQPHSSQRVWLTGNTRSLLRRIWAAQNQQQNEEDSGLV